MYFVMAVTAIVFGNSFESSILNLLLTPLICILFVLAVFQISRMNSVIYTIIFYTIFACSEVAYEIIYRMLSNVLSFPMTPWYEQESAGFFLTEYFFKFLLLLFLERFMRKLKIEPRNDYAWYLLIMPVSSLVILSNFISIDFSRDIYIQIWMAVGAVLVIVSNAAVFIILAKVTGIMNRVKYEEMYQVRRDAEGDKYERVARLNEKYRNYMHDVHNYLGNIRMLALKGENQRIVHIINSVEGEIREEIDGIAYCGNEVLNAILEDKKVKAEKENIDFKVEVERFLNLDFLSEADMISMFGNLLDNAIEAAEKCEESNKRVNFKMFMGNPYMLVTCIENSFCVRAEREGSRLLSTKEEEGIHGLGIHIVKGLAEKYGGNLEWEEEGNVFRSILSISNMSQ